MVPEPEVLMLIELKGKMDTQAFLTTLFSKNGINVSKISDEVLKQFTKEYKIEDSIKSISVIQDKIMSDWKVKSRVLNFNDSSLMIPNGKQGQKYKYTFNPDYFKNFEITNFEFQGLEEVGLAFDEVTFCIEGEPIVNGDLKIKLLYKVEGESEDSEMNIKIINLIINADPKSLWKNIPSNKEAIFWKEDLKSASAKVGDKSIIISSRRGRSHENVGSFRDDDFAFKYFEESKWTVVAVSDGAGSATLSRKGSELACNEVVSQFEELIKSEELKGFEEKLNEFSETKDEELIKEAEIDSKKFLYKISLGVHNSLATLAKNTYESNLEVFNNPKAKSILDYFHSTLIYTAYKKFNIGYVFLTFSVGDCPIGIVNKEKTEAKLLNWLDVGEFGGGTRFVTQPEIFTSQERPPATRFNFHVQSDFSFLFLMSDGIYDPKFEVEANLEKSEKWIEFIADLEGSNEDNLKVTFDTELEVAEEQLNKWINFWSKGNHDDRTLAILF